MSNDKMREQLLDALEFIFMLADKQKQIDCSREYQLIKAALTQKPSENRGTYHIDSFTCEGYAGTQQPESEAVAFAKDGNLFWHGDPTEKRGVNCDLFASPQPSARVPEGWRTALENLLAYAWRQICMHEDTHRGGSIWEICDQCGARWADDEGGRPDFATPPEIEAAEELLAAPSKAEKDQ